LPHIAYLAPMCKRAARENQNCRDELNGPGTSRVLRLAPVLLQCELPPEPAPICLIQLMLSFLCSFRRPRC